MGVSFCLRHKHLPFKVLRDEIIALIFVFAVYMHNSSSPVTISWSEGSHNKDTKQALISRIDKLFLCFLSLTVNLVQCLCSWPLEVKVVVAEVKTRVVEVAQQTYYPPIVNPLSSLSYLTDQQMKICKNCGLSHLFSCQRCKDILQQYHETCIRCALNRKVMAGTNRELHSIFFPKFNIETIFETGWH